VIDNKKIPFVPEGWECISVKEAIYKISLTNRKLKQKEYIQEGKLPVVDQGQELIGGYTDNEEMKVSAETPLIIFGDHTRVFKYIPFDFVAGADGIKVLKPKGMYLSKLLYYLLQSVRFPYKGYARHYQYLEKSYIPLPPLPEQHRIIAKIEELFTKLDAGVEALKLVQSKLIRYRQSVLKAAIEGKLTAEWREQHKDELESADKLLERILKERREKWEAEQSAKYEAQGKTPPKNWKNKYKEPTAPNTTDLAALPEGWVWCTGDQLTIKIVDGTHHTPKYTEQGIPFISVKNVRNDKIYFNACKYISEEEHIRLIKRCFPQKGDVLITKSGTIGRTAVIDSHQEFSLFVSVALLKRCSEAIYSKYLKLFLDGYIQSINVQQIVKGGVIKNLHLEDLRIVPLRLVSEAEQEEIVRKVDQLYSIIEKMDSLIESELKRAQSLHQSILKCAFEGKLVPQDPNDEPASGLLERIKSEKAKPKKAKQLELS